jgi:hypothetical protein
MPRPHDSLFGPIAFALVAAVFAAGAAYTWWLDHRAAAATPLSDLRAATPLPEWPSQQFAPPVAQPTPSRGTRTLQAPATVSRCVGADGVPIFTSMACPAGSRLDKQVAVDVRDPPPLVAAASRAVAGAVAVATVNNYAQGGYYDASPQEQRHFELERAQRQCEQARLRERAELLALGLDRKMKHVRQWADHVEHECAMYKVLSRRH